MTRNTCVSLIALAVVLSIAQQAQAQRRGRGGMRMGNVAGVQLVAVDDVQKELKLTDDQMAKAAAIHEEFMTGRREAFAAADRESGQRGEKMKELREKSDKTVNELLDEAQRKRLREILLQVNGAAELDKKEIAAELKITDEQKKKLAEARRGVNQQRRDALEALEQGGTGSRGEKLAELQREADKKLLEVLTEEQRTQFEAMKGTKLDLKLFDE